MIGLATAPETSWLRRVPAGAKLGGLLVFGGAVFLIGSATVLAFIAGVAALFLRSTGRPATALARDLAWPIGVLLFVLGATALLDDPGPALVSFLRLLAILFAAHAVTLTTTTAELMAAIEALLAPLDRRGLVDAGRVSLTLTLAIRFIPVIAEEAREIRDAQAARGLAAHPLALAVPLAVRVLVRAEAVADAIEARGFAAPRNGGVISGAAASPGAPSRPGHMGPTIKDGNE
jgi:biotin transport system permease protein